MISGCEILQQWSLWENGDIRQGEAPNKPTFGNLKSTADLLNPANMRFQLNVNSYISNGAHVL